MIAYHFPYENKTSNNRMMSPVAKCDCQLVVKTGKEQAELHMVQKVNILVNVSAISAVAFCIEKLGFWNSKHRFWGTYSACINEVYLHLIL